MMSGGMLVVKITSSTIVQVYVCIGSKTPATPFMLIVIMITASEKTREFTTIMMIGKNNDRIQIYVYFK